MWIPYYLCHLSNCGALIEIKGESIIHWGGGLNVASIDCKERAGSTRFHPTFLITVLYLYACCRHLMPSIDATRVGHSQ